MENVTSSSMTQTSTAPLVQRPNVVAVGTIVWLGSEVMFFAGLFAIYFTLRSTSPELWNTESSILNVPFATVNTLILVSSSFTCQFGVFAAERLQSRATGWKPTQWGMVEWFFLTYVLGALFVSGQVWEYSNLVEEGVTLNSSSYGSAFYLTTGFHALHVTAGLFTFLLMIGRAFGVKNFGHREATSAIVVSYYWHFVDVVWIGLFLVIYILK
ncbi:aa3-type cytochrome oxidase subunit III [Subtercola boreus]|uniref:cytochrome-c oxidase n=1 Tax=Subtercola boreus TaxID=120213 RepID=A0A3E0WCM7_9MICO|nr:heme-copper oxidase subunit III [Subtercola boreus]RFA21116.1 cytochrome B [Subtercola boreus]RFA21499.1 cytochrome B [Subtercola boreus]RFA27470.1 cytochrome B [Subtercola boreus]